MRGRHREDGGPEDRSTEQRGTEERSTEERWRERLHAEAERHEPHEESMWARVEAGTATTVPAPRRRIALRMTAAAVGTAAATAAGSLVAVKVAGHDSTPVMPLAQRSHGSGGPAEPPSTTPAPGGSTGHTAGQSRPATAPTSSGTPEPTPGSITPRPPDGTGFVTVSAAIDPHSSAYWAQNNLAMRATRPLSGLTVTIRVDRTQRVEPTGSWLSLPQSDFEISTDAERDTVVYRWRLRAGRTVPAGAYTLAAQYNRAGGHDPRKDLFTVTATAPGGSDSTLKGHF